MNYRVVSLFSGAGGADLGFVWAGFDVVFANDNDPVAIKTYEMNLLHPVWPSAIQFLNELDVPDSEVIIGGPPCTSFSDARHASGKFRTLDGLSNLNEMQRIVMFKRPIIFICENVPALLDPKLLGAYAQFAHGWHGYNVNHFKLSAECYGIPQRRERLFFVGIRDDLPYIFRRPKGTHWSDIWTGWAEYLGLDDSHVILKRTSAVNAVPFDAAAPTVTTADQLTIRRHGQPLGLTTEEQISQGVNSRYATIWELKRLQGFPDGFELYGNRSDKLRQIGNAWNTAVSHAIAEEVNRCLNYYAQMLADPGLN